MTTALLVDDRPKTVSERFRRWQSDTVRLINVVVPLFVVVWFAWILITGVNSWGAVWLGSPEGGSWLVFGSITVLGVCLAPRQPRIALAALSAVVIAQAGLAFALALWDTYYPYDRVESLLPVFPLHYGLSAGLWIGVGLFLVAFSPRGIRVHWLVLTFIALALALLVYTADLVVPGLPRWENSSAFDVTQYRSWLYGWPPPNTMALLYLGGVTVGRLLNAAGTQNVVARVRGWLQNPTQTVFTAAPVTVAIWFTLIGMEQLSWYGFDWLTSTTGVSWLVFGSLMVACVWLAPRFPNFALTLLMLTVAVQTFLPESHVSHLRYLVFSTLEPLYRQDGGSAAVIWAAIALFLIGLSPHSKRMSRKLLGVAGAVIGGMIFFSAQGRGMSQTGAFMGAPIWAAAFGAIAVFGRVLADAQESERLARTRAFRSVRRGEAQARKGRAFAEERQRIAGEVHDTLAHSLTVVLAQAEGALRGDDTEREANLENIATVSRSALREVRGLIERLDTGGTIEGQPTLAQVSALLDSIRAAGLDVQFTESAGVPLSEPMQATAYRILQEALTNALKYSDTTQPATALLDWAADPREVKIRVFSALAPVSETDDPELAELTTGRGVEGMRLRAELAGGTFTAGADGDIWRVAATLPIEGGGV